jgi:hypothetical protein
MRRIERPERPDDPNPWALADGPARPDNPDEPNIRVSASREKVEGRFTTSLPDGCDSKAEYLDWIWEASVKAKDGTIVHEAPPTHGKAVLTAVLTSYRPGHNTFPSNQLIADRAGMSKARAKQVLRFLRWSGWIKSSRRNFAGNNTSNVYTFLDGRKCLWIEKDPSKVDQG